MFCKVLLNFWKDSEPEMSTITSSKTAIAAVARIYAKGIVDLLAFVFSTLPLRPILRILITAYLLTRTAWLETNLMAIIYSVPTQESCLEGAKQLHTSDEYEIPTAMRRRSGRHSNARMR